MHTKVVYQARRRSAGSAARCCASISAASARAPARLTNGTGETDDFRVGARLHARRAYPDVPLWVGRHVVRIVDRADGRRRGSRVSRRSSGCAAAGALRLRARSRAARSRSSSSTASATSLFRSRMREFYARARRAEGTRRSSTARIICSTARSSEVADAVEELLGDWHDMKPSSSRPSERHRARRRTERCAARGPTNWRRPPSARRCGARRALDPADVDDVILGCAMPEAEQGMNVARIASLRAGIPGQRLGGHGQPVLFVGPAGDRLRGRTRDVRLRVGDRRRRHRVDEPGADGRQQDRAEPDAHGHLSGRVSEHRARRRESRARVGHFARGTGRVCAPQPSARAGRDRRAAGSPTRSFRVHGHVAGRADGERRERPKTPRRSTFASTKDRGATRRPRRWPNCGRRFTPRAPSPPATRRRRATAPPRSSSCRPASARERGLTPLGPLRRPSRPPASSRSASASARCRPFRKALKLAGLTLDQIDLVELNEAFAAQVLACLKELPIDPERLNVNGGAIALGHPLGCTGAKLTTTIAARDEAPQSALRHGHDVRRRRHGRCRDL